MGTQKVTATDYDWLLDSVTIPSNNAILNQGESQEVTLFFMAKRGKQTIRFLTVSLQILTLSQKWSITRLQLVYNSLSSIFLVTLYYANIVSLE